MLRPGWLLLGLLTVACGSGGGDDGDDAVTNRDGGSSATVGCGVPGSRVAEDCEGFDDCGGSANVSRRGNCEHCPNEALFRTCSKGRCVEYDRTGTIRVGFTVDQLGVGANSFVVMVIDPEGGDGTDLTCAAIMSSCRLKDTYLVNVTNVDLGEPPGGLQRDRSYTRSMTAHVGSGRIAYVLVTEQSDGNGRIVAHGCGERATVASGESTDVLIELRAYER